MPWDLKMTDQFTCSLWNGSSKISSKGVYQPGGKIPSVRELALEAAVNPNTMQKHCPNWNAADSLILKEQARTFYYRRQKLLESI